MLAVAQVVELHEFLISKFDIEVKNVSSSVRLDVSIPPIKETRYKVSVYFYTNLQKQYYDYTNFLMTNNVNALVSIA